MDTALKLFDYEEKTIRTLMIDGNIWFVAKDICDVLGIQNVTQAINPLDDDERSMFYIGGQGEANIISESGLYSLVFRSTKPEAKSFSKWVRKEVLPQLRKTGSYSLNQNITFSSDILTATKIILEAAGIKDNQLALALDKVARHYTGQSLLALSGVALIAPTNHQLLTPTQIGRHFGLSGKKINQLLVSAGYQHKLDKGYEPLADGEEFAVMLDTNKKHSDGTPIRQLKWDSSIIPELHNSFNELNI